MKKNKSKDKGDEWEEYYSVKEPEREVNRSTSVKTDKVVRKLSSSESLKIWIAFQDLYTRFMQSCRTGNYENVRKLLMEEKFVSLEDLKKVLDEVENYARKEDNRRLQGKAFETSVGIIQELRRRLKI